MINSIMSPITCRGFKHGRGQRAILQQKYPWYPRGEYCCLEERFAQNTWTKMEIWTRDVGRQGFANANYYLDLDNYDGANPITDKEPDKAFYPCE